jgi:transcriptional antiterminator NusG
VRLIVGAETKPVPLTDTEYKDIMNQVNQSQERSALKIPYNQNDVVLLKTGDFKGMQGTIKEIDANKGQVVVHVEMLGRLTPVVIDIDKIELL